MKRRLLITRVMAVFASLSLNTLIYAGNPLWTFSSLTPATLSIPANGTRTIEYKVCNQSTKPHQLKMREMSGVTQTVSCNLKSKGTPGDCCTLTLAVTGNQLPAHGILGGPALCQANSNGTPNPNQCYQPSQTNILRITKGPAQYTVGAVISGLNPVYFGGTVLGVTDTVTLLNNGTNSTPTSTDGPFTFSTPIAEGSTYNVTIGTQPTDQTCTIANGSGTMGGRNIRNVAVTCSTNPSALSNITLQNKSGSPVTVYALYVPQLSYTSTDCNLSTVLYTSTNASGAFLMPVTMMANQKIPIGQNFLYNMLYTAIYYYNQQALTPSPCTLPGCTWGVTDTTVYNWCIFLGALSPASGNTATTSSVPPYAGAVSGAGYNYDLVTQYNSIGPITCNDQNLTCSVSSAQNVAFPH
jgi:hypothetical protein